MTFFKKRIGLKRRQPERDEQIAFFDWLSQYPNVRALTNASANGGSRNPIEAKNLKRSGVTAGFPDITVYIPINGVPALFIEMKSGKNTLSPAQKKVIPLLCGKGYRCEVCYSYEEARKVMEDYLGTALYENK